MASVENDEFPPSWRLFVFSPQETMVEFIRSRFLEMRDTDPLGVNSLKGPVNDSVFAASIHRLQNNQDFLLVLCIEHLLKLSKFFVELLRLFAFIRIFSNESGSIVLGLSHPGELLVPARFYIGLYEHPLAI